MPWESSAGKRDDPFNVSFYKKKWNYQESEWKLGPRMIVSSYCSSFLDLWLYWEQVSSKDHRGKWKEVQTSTRVAKNVMNKNK